MHLLDSFWREVVNQRVVWHTVNPSKSCQARKSGQTHAVFACQEKVIRADVAMRVAAVMELVQGVEQRHQHF